MGASGGLTNDSEEIDDVSVLWTAVLLRYCGIGLVRTARQV